MQDRPWFQAWPKCVPASIDYPRIPLPSLLDDAATRFPSRSAIILYDSKLFEERGEVSYQKLQALTNKFSSALLSLGLRKQDPVAIYLSNSIELVTTFYGSLKAGAIVVPCNPMYKERELLNQIKDAACKAIVCSVSLYQIVERILPETNVEHVILAGDYPETIHQEKELHNLNSLVEEGNAESPDVSIDPMKDLALLQYTGGTTGVPKGAMLTHYNLVANTIQFSKWYDFRDGEEVCISALPLFHIGGIAGAMNVPISKAATMILLPRFKPEAVLKAIQNYKATRFFGVPTMYAMILDHSTAPAYDLTSLKASRTSAASLPPAVKKRFDELVGHEVLIEGYGLTETSPLTHANPVERAKPGSIGIPLPDTDARIVDMEKGDQELGPEEVGELVVKGPQIMLSYWNMPEENNLALRNGWFYTGDLARMDPEGYFYIVDRKKDMINAAGFKVWPREVEEVLYQHEAVKLAAVVGIPDKIKGERVKAFVVLNDRFRNKVSTDEIIGFCRSVLANYKVPSIVELRDELPTNAAGKILKRELREQEILKASQEGFATQKAQSVSGRVFGRN